jgi:putative transposase
MRKAFKYRIFPTKAQRTRMEETLEKCRLLYNAGLEQRRSAYQRQHVSLSKTRQQADLPDLKAAYPEFSEVYSQVLQDVLARLDKAFDAFFRRVKRGEKAGYPRFRGKGRYDSFTYPQLGFGLKDGRLHLAKIGAVKIKLHRAIVGQVKTLTIRRTATGKWFAGFAVDAEPVPITPQVASVGVDMGLHHFATLSTGEHIENPRFFRSDERALAKAQHRLSAAPKGTPERAKRRKVVAQGHERISNRRQNFVHQLSRRLVNTYGLIVFEALRIQNMLHNHALAKSIADAAWGLLIQYSTYKAADAGGSVIQVNPAYTSQDCSGCGARQASTLSDRVYVCLVCGLVRDRDHNASINIEARGLASLCTSARSPRIQPWE